MKILKKISIAIAVLMAIYIILALIGPSNYKIERSIKIASAVENVYNQTSIYANWAAWSPWKKADPEAIYNIENDHQEVGASLGWKGELSGTGSMTTVEIVPNEKFNYELKFTEPWYMAMTSSGGFTYEQDGDSVLVTWFDAGDLGFMSRPMMLFMDMEGQIGPQFEAGLEELKKICEAMPKASSIEITEETVASQPMLYIEESALLIKDDVPGKIGSAYGEIMALMSVANVEMTSAPIAITNEFSLQEMKWVFDCAIIGKLPEGTEVSGRVKSGDTYAGKVVKGVHIGSYEQSIITYQAIEKYMESNNLEQNGRSWEEYIDDPAEVAVENLRTFIYFPVK